MALIKDSSFCSHVEITSAWRMDKLSLSTSDLAISQNLINPPTTFQDGTKCPKEDLPRNLVKPYNCTPIDFVLSSQP